MSIWSKISGAFRRGGSNLPAVQDLGESTPVDPKQIRYIFVPSRHAGVYVDHDTAMTFSAVYRAVAYLSQSVAMLPWIVIRETDQRTIKLKNHAVWPLLQVQANPEMANYTWEETMVAWACSWGNAYSEIEFDGAGRPVALWPIEPYRVKPKRAVDPQSNSPLTGPLVYQVNNNLGGQVNIPAERMFHLHGLGFNGLVGYSVISLAARSIGLSIGSEQFAEDLFANGPITHGALKHPKTLSADAKKNIRDSFNEVVQGHGRRFNVPIFEEGMDWIDLMINPEDAQLLLTRKFQVTDIARWFGLPPHKLADLERATFSNLEAQNIEVVNDALMPWIIRLEQEADRKLLSGRERNVRTKIETRAFLRGDSAARAKYYQVMRSIGVYSTNTILRLEDMDPVGPEGDALIMQSGFTTLEKIVNGDSSSKSPAAPPEPPTPAFPAKKASLGYFQEAQNRIFRREMGRFEQVRHKLNGDCGLFNEWMRRFSAKHREYMHQVLEPLAVNFVGLIRPGINVDAAVGAIVSRYIDLHLEGSTAELLDIFNGKQPSDIERRADFWARVLIDRLAEGISNISQIKVMSDRLPPAAPRARLQLPMAPPPKPGPDDWTEIGVEPNGG